VEPSEPRWRAGTADVVGIDISGRHEEAGEYLMVAAAVAATVDSNRLRDVGGMGFATSHGQPTLENTLAVAADSVSALPIVPPGPVVAERGEFYEEPAIGVAPSFDAGFKYVESIAERRTVEVAHHAAYAARELLL
jgi:hypothetical protein